MFSKKLFALVVLFLALPLILSAQNKGEEIILNGIKMVPNVQTSATGTAYVWVQSDTIYVSGKFMDLQSYYYTSNIHYGEKGETGNPIYRLHPDVSEDHTSGTFHPDNNKFKLSEAMLEAFNNGNLYITVASDKRRRGEIRGQINSY